MTPRLNRAEFREFLTRNLNTTYKRGSACECPLACFLRETWPEGAPVVTTVDYSVGMHIYPFPAWAERFVVEYDDGRILPCGDTGHRATIILDAIPFGPEDEDDDEHPGRAMLNESPPTEDPDESPDYDDERENEDLEHGEDFDE